ncbi:glycosyl hydrolase [Tritrichomonas foetus]|uniref:alpha-mannosidase n=1 Tax=Tritrichomonas foetus TaxID=1144522 RepID=A0A1J4J8D6_9EUKA|nr:glycosyl hydrolase [Tritrichomonas foetus]|eukprot:OHS95400.1 glycosyl hydrolase [Tritrichomonas foetus]
MIYDPEHILPKFNKYLELINTCRVISFEPAHNCLICKKAYQFFDLPSSHDLSWEYFDASQKYDFGTTQDDWFAFQCDIIIKNPNLDLFHKFEFNIERNYLVRAWDDDSPSGPEGRCWLNTNFLSSIDSFHDGSVILEDGHVEALIFTSHCLSQHKLRKLGVTTYHKSTEMLYRILKCYLELINELDENNFDRSKLINHIDKSLRLLDIRDLSYPIQLKDIRIHDKSKKSFYSSVNKCLNMILSFNNGKERNENDFSVNIIGYSHLDSCWLWPFSISKSKIVNTMTTTLNLLDFPNSILSHSSHDKKTEIKWKFLQTAPQHLKWIEENDKELYQKILNKNDRIFIDGAMWIESDTTLSSGETLVRQLMMVNENHNVLFLPDCFGFSASLPQLMKLAGIEGFITSKISWSEYTKFPYSTFKWRGIDGTDVLAHFITCPNDSKPGTTKYVGTNTSHEIMKTYENYKQKSILPHSSLCLMGRGDGGGGVDEEMIWNLYALSRLPPMNSVPKILFPDLKTLFNGIKEKRDEINIWDDELYLEKHSGTLTSQEEVKRVCKMFESLLQSIEWLIVVNKVMNQKYHNLKIQKVIDCYEIDLTKYWYNNLLFHFHDSVTGTSTNQANLELISIAHQNFKKLNEIKIKLLKNFSNYIKIDRSDINQERQLLINTLNHDRIINENLAIPCGGWKILSSHETQYKMNEFTVEFYERIASDDSFKINKFKYEENQLESSNNVFFDPSSKIVTTESLIITFNEKSGHISSIFNKNNNREYLAMYNSNLSNENHPEEGNQFLLYEDRSVAYPAWDIQLYHKEMQLKSPTLELFEFNEKAKNLRTVHKINEKSEIEQIITFQNNKITFISTVKWLEHDKLLKVIFPTSIRSRTANYGIQFGHIERSTHQNTLRDVAKYEVFGRWANLSDSNSGITICSDVKGGYDIHNGKMMLSLLKAPMQTDKWCDYGIRHFTYQINIHSHKFKPSLATRISDELNYPYLIYNTKSENTENSMNLLPREGSFVQIDNENVILETLKPSKNNSFVARFYEASGGSQKATITFPFIDKTIYDAFIVDFHENPVDIIENNAKLKVEKELDSLVLNITFNAFEIITIYFRDHYEDIK